MDVIYKKAKAKINLTLNVLEKRADGYHNIESIFQKINLYDEIFVKKGKGTYGIKIKSNIKELENENNIIYKAYALLKEKFSNICEVEVILKKKIPMQAGLGGGSSDCAGFIECINKIFSLNLDKKQMQEIGLKLGADVPAAFEDMPIVVRGIGEKIERINSKFKYYVVLIKPNFSCNTKEMYDRLDNTSDIKQLYNSEKVKSAIVLKNINVLSENLYNVFENSVYEVDILKEKMMKLDALGSAMTGSGSCIYGIFDNKNSAKYAFDLLSKDYETYFCITN